jgi:hypothetical protein
MLKISFIVQALNPSGTWRDLVKSDQEIQARKALDHNRAYNAMIGQSAEFRLIKRTITEEILDASEIDEDTWRVR